MLGLGGFKAGGVEKDPPEQGHATAVRYIGQGDGVHLLGAVGEVGVDDDGLRVAGDKQRRVAQIFAVEQELLVCFVEVGVATFVFPNELPKVEDIGTPFAAVVLDGAGLEGEEVACGVGFYRRGVADKGADVVEVGLGDGYLFLAGGLPFGHKLGGGNVLGHRLLVRSGGFSRSF